MAYAVFNNNEICRIAANENEKNDLNLLFLPAIAKDISDEDFLKLKKNNAIATISGDTVSITDISSSFENEENLTKHISFLKTVTKDFLNPNSDNNEKILYSTINNYYNTLNSFDVSTITFPLNKSWEDYCEENSIAYVSHLQIP